jgi:hypothetical protein
MQRIIFFKAWRSHSGEYGDAGHLGADAVRCSISPPETLVSKYTSTRRYNLEQYCDTLSLW